MPNSPKMLKNDIQVTITNDLCEGAAEVDEWDPMRDEYENPLLNCYQHGPGSNLDPDLQRPAYRDKNNKPVFKIMVNRIPRGMSKNGLENILSKFGSPTIAKHGMADKQLTWALVELKSLQEAQQIIVNLNESPPFNMKINFALSDEENERRKKEQEEAERSYEEMKLSFVNQNFAQTPAQNDTQSKLKGLILRTLGRGQNRGRCLLNASRQYSNRGGLRNCKWSDGIPDFRDPGGLIYDPRSNFHETTNRHLQGTYVPLASPVRRVAAGRGYIPAKSTEEYPIAEVSLPISVGMDIRVPLQYCKTCGAQTTLMCKQCGTPYCSRGCQKQDFVKHRPFCTFKECIDVSVENAPLNSSRLVPITKPAISNQTVTSISPTKEINRFWGKPEKNVVSYLKADMNVIVSINSGNLGRYHGVLSCNEVCDITSALVQRLPSSLKNVINDNSFWPAVGSLVAARFENTIWRGYIVNAPILGSSDKFLVALCDLGKVKSIDCKDILRLPSEYFDYPELAVTCEVLQGPENIETSLAQDPDWSLKIKRIQDGRLCANVYDQSGRVLGDVLLYNWEPDFSRHLTAVRFDPPCSVLISAYHNQDAVYVRPIGRVFQEQLFTILQRVAEVYVTSPDLGRPPYKEEMVACRYRNDGNFYRAIVYDAKGIDEYSVFFVDFGNIDTVLTTDMKKLPEELKLFPCMAVKVTLKGVKKGPLTKEAVYLLNSLVQKEAQLRLECCDRQSAEGVELILPDNRNLNSLLNDFLTPEWEKSLKEGLDPYKGKVYMLDDFNVLPLLKDGRKGHIQVVVSNVLPDGRVAVCPTGSSEVEHVVETLFLQINEYCESTDPSQAYNPRQNEVCLAKYKDETWHRAVNIETIQSTQSCEVLFLDFGNLENVPFKHIRRMVSDFVSAKTIISLCVVDGCPLEPTASIVERIRQLINTNQVYDVEVLEELSVGQYKIFIPQISNQLKSEFCQP